MDDNFLFMIQNRKYYFYPMYIYIIYKIKSMI